MSLTLAVVQTVLVLLSVRASHHVITLGNQQKGDVPIVRLSYIHISRVARPLHILHIYIQSFKAFKTPRPACDCEKLKDEGTPCRVVMALTSRRNVSALPFPHSLPFPCSPPPRPAPLPQTHAPPVAKRRACPPLTLKAPLGFGPTVRPSVPLGHTSLAPTPTRGGRPS